MEFQGTIEQKEQLEKIVAEHKGTDGALIPVLHKVQEIYGYLPIEVQKMVAVGLDVPLSEVYGVVTFYTQFTTEPRGEFKIGVCLGTACYVKGSGEILYHIRERLGLKGSECSPDGKFSIDETRCIGACGLAPVVTINDDVYGRLTVDEIDGILAKY